ncbi:MAG: nuclear transport factor 2 family protein [Pseudomonadota bacterium]
MIKGIGLIIGILHLSALPAFAETREEFQRVANAVEKYIDGTENGKPELLEDAFLPSFEMQWVDDQNKLARMPASDFINIFRDGKFRERNAEIISLDVSGNAATAKLHLTFNNRRYTDYLLLLQVDGEWKISHKILHSVEN